MLVMQDNGSLIISIDALFGLCRKKSAGSSVHGPLSGTVIFDSQQDVNSYMESESCSRISYNNCEVRIQSHYRHIQ